MLGRNYHSVESHCFLLWSHIYLNHGALWVISFQYVSLYSINYRSFAYFSVWWLDKLLKSKNQNAHAKEEEIKQIVQVILLICFCAILFGCDQTYYHLGMGIYIQLVIWEIRHNLIFNMELSISYCP